MDVHQITSGQRAGLTVRGGANGELPCSRAQRHQSNLLSLSQALPYVALLIAMIFFIYAVIGMQVSSYTGDPAGGTKIRSTTTIRSDAGWMDKDVPLEEDVSLRSFRTWRV